MPTADQQTTPADRLLGILLKDNNIKNSNRNEVVNSLIPHSLLEAAVETSLHQKASRLRTSPAHSQKPREQQEMNPSKLYAELTGQLRNDVISTLKQQVADDESFFALAKALSGFPRLTYSQFINFKEKFSSPIQKFFTAATFLLFPWDENASIVSEDFLRFVQRSIDVETVTLNLIRYAKEQRGYLTEKELERYIFDLIPTLGGCSQLTPSFYPYYVFTSSRRFCFFLDHRHTKRIPIKKLAHSTIMEELLFLNRITQYRRDLDEASFNSQINSNWFSGNNALRVYSEFLQLDRDENGMLSIDEFLTFSRTPKEGHEIQFTRAAAHRIFEETITYADSNEMDYKTFLDVVLAIENKTTIEALEYWWRILDIDKCGRLTKENIAYFYRGVYDILRLNKYEAPSISNVIVEIFDIVGCNDSRGPTFEDLVKSGNGHIVAFMLLDVNGFWQYDNRESLLQQPSGGGDDGEDDH